MASATKKTWLVTGANSGLGLCITLSALRAGYLVIATARNVQKAAQDNPQVEELGAKWLQLDVRSEETEQIVRDGIETLGAGKLDVVVNNAGNTVVGSLEDSSIPLINDMFSTHLLGALRVLKGALPTLRAQQSGTIVNMSSIMGQITFPGAGVYSLCKFALEGASEALAAEVASFGIRVVVLEPGNFRTDLIKKALVLDEAPMSEHYRDSRVGATRAFAQALVEKEDDMVAGDPVKLGDRVVEIVDGVGMGEGLGGVLRIPMGSDAAQTLEGKIRKMQEEFEKTRDLALSCSYDGHTGQGLAAHK